MPQMFSDFLVNLYPGIFYTFTDLFDKLKTFGELCLMPRVRNTFHFEIIFYSSIDCWKILHFTEHLNQTMWIFFLPWNNIKTIWM